MGRALMAFSGSAARGVFGGRRNRRAPLLVAAVAVVGIVATALPAGAHEPSPRTPPLAETGNCVGALPIVVASDASAQSDMYSAVTLAGALGTECVILAGTRGEPFPAAELECLDAAGSGGYVVGGTAAVPESKIAGRSLRRIAGSDRWKTAEAVGAEVQRVLATLDDAARKRNAGTGKAGTRGCGDGDPSDSSSDAQGEVLSATEIYAKVSPSIPIVRSCIGHGTGILIDGGYIVTNDHVVFDCAAVTVLFPDGTEFTDVPVLATNPWADIAVLGPIQTSKRKLALADGEGLPPGSDLYLIGYPAEFEESPQTTIAKGILSRVRQWNSYDLTLLQTDAQTTGGQSGGPLLDDRGRVVGVLTWGWTDANFGIATSAVDQVEIIELMLDDDDEYEYSLDWGSRVAGSGSGSQSFRLPAGRHSRSYLIDHDGQGDVTVQLHDCTDAWMWVADVYWPVSELDSEGNLPRRVRFSADESRLSFVEVGRSASGSTSCRLSSNVDLVEYSDESGAELRLGSDGTAGSAGVFDYFLDEDEYEIELTRNDIVRFWVDSTNADTALTIHDGEGNVVAEDDNSGPPDFLGERLNPEIRFRAPATGTYFVNVSYSDETSGSPAGSYLLFAEKTN